MVKKYLLIQKATEAVYQTLCIVQAIHGKGDSNVH